MTHRNYVHHAEPWELTTTNGRIVAVGLGEINGPAAVSEFAYLGVDSDTFSSTLLTADEVTAVIDQLTIVRNAMGADA